MALCSVSEYYLDLFLLWQTQLRPRLLYWNRYQPRRSNPRGRSRGHRMKSRTSLVLSVAWRTRKIVDLVWTDALRPSLLLMADTGFICLVKMNLETVLGSWHTHGQLVSLMAYYPPPPFLSLSSQKDRVFIGWTRPDGLMLTGFNSTLLLFALCSICLKLK